MKIETNSTQDSKDSLHLALARSRSLLVRGALSEEELHKVKSLLYALLERLGMKAEEVSQARSKLLLLFHIITSSFDLREEERASGLKILDELEAKTSL